MFCKNCGAPVPEDAKFCIHCGRSVQPGGSQAQQSQSAAPGEAKRAPARSGRNGRIILLSVLIPVILALTVLATVLVMRMLDKPADAPAPVADVTAPAIDVPVTDVPALSDPATPVPAAPVVTDADDIPDNMTSADGKYQIAFITDVGQLKDHAYNEDTYDGVKLYAAANGKSYRYYQPAGGDQTTDEDRYDAMREAVEGGAEVVVCAGYMQEAALKKAAAEFTEVPFIFIDGYPLTLEDGTTLTNVAGISFREEQAGYLAGYAVVKDGFEKLGFAGGGGGVNPAVCRYGYGFVQGANDAAAEMGKTVEMNYTFQYGANFRASPELQSMICGWYTNGTQIVFSCGGDIFQSIASAASANDGYVIGVDVDQSRHSDTVVTSAAKNLSVSVQWALTKVYDGTFYEIGGFGTALGANEDAVGLPTDTWAMESFTVAEHEALLAAMKNGSLVVDDQFPEDPADIRFPNVQLVVI